MVRCRVLGGVNGVLVEVENRGASCGVEPTFVVRRFSVCWLTKPQRNHAKHHLPDASRRRKGNVIFCFGLITRAQSVVLSIR